MTPAQLEMPLGPNEAGRWRDQPRPKRVRRPSTDLATGDAVPALADMTCAGCGARGVSVLGIERDAAAAVVLRDRVRGGGEVAVAVVSSGEIARVARDPKVSGRGLTANDVLAVVRAMEDAGFVVERRVVEGAEGCKVEAAAFVRGVI